jgi:hypothetical protein
VHYSVIHIVYLHVVSYEESSAEHPFYHDIYFTVQHCRAGIGRDLSEETGPFSQFGCARREEMKILLVHNRYQQYGGEDATYESEKELLESHGHTVRSLLFDNSQIRGIGQRIKAGIQMIYNKESEGLLDKAIREFRPDLMHVHNFFYLASPSIFFAAEKNRVPIVVTLQNYRLICSGGLLMRNSEPCELCVNEIFPLSGVRYRCHRNSRLGTAYLTFQTGLHKLWNTWDQKITRYIAVTEFAKNKFMSSSLGL